MNDCNVFKTLGQVSASEAGTVFRDHIRGCVRQMISEVMAAEVSELCGPKHAPDESEHFRAGTSSGRVLFEGEEVVRPRVRKRNNDDRSEEVVLATYQAAGDWFTKSAEEPFSAPRDKWRIFFGNLSQ